MGRWAQRRHRGSATGVNPLAPACITIISAVDQNDGTIATTWSDNIGPGSFDPATFTIPLTGNDGIDFVGSGDNHALLTMEFAFTTGEILQYDGFVDGVCSPQTIEIT